MVQPLSPVDRLALSLASSPAEHVLLLGSGISRAASIPTGWEVTCDLIRHIMAVRGVEDPERPPEAWFEETFGESPNYSRVLEQAASIKSERQRLIKRYFEPSDDDGEDVKRPTAAHRAIAHLVKLGLVKVIVTTNFDRLLEAALHEVQVEPVVLATPDAFAGAAPVHRNRCTIIKVHGDYLDHEILNIDEELSAYPEVLNALLDRVFDEHGVIVSGWSSEYDGALRAALERRTNRRYYSVWTHRGDVRELAERLITQQGFERLQVQDSDTFFGELHTKAEAAVYSIKARPESAELVASEAKRALTQPAPLIAYRDLAMREAERVRQQIEAMGLNNCQGRVGNDGLTKRFDDLLDVSASLRRVLALGVFYRDQDVAEVVASIFQSFMRKAEKIGYPEYSVGSMTTPRVTCNL